MLNSAKRILSVTALLILVSTKLNCLTITTDGCGTEKGCFRSPDSCTSNCDFLVTYNVTSPNTVEFELSGKGDWVAVGFSDDQFMPDTDILMCVSNANLSGHYYASGRITPDMTTPTPSAVNVTEQANDGGIIKCRISRDINPSPAIQNFKNLSEEVYLLGAIGSLSGVTIQQHSNRQSSNSKINVMQVEDPTTAPTTTASTTTAPAQGSFRIPDSCSSSDDCDFLVTYQRIGDTVQFELSGRAGWAGVGFSDDQNMANTDLLMCVSDQSESGHYYAEGRFTPTMTTPTPSAVRIVGHSNEGGVVKCNISRDINPGITNFRDLSQPWFLLGAIGDFDGVIQRHSLRQSTASRITVTEAGSAFSDEGIDSSIIAHGTLMTLAWILFAAAGMFTARFMRVVWEPKQLLGTKAWFTVHWTLMTTTVLLTVAGIVVIFVEKGEWSSGAGAHPYLGIIVLALALAQPIMAVFRPHPDEPRRIIFNWAHRIVGTLALFLGVITVYLGLQLNDIRLEDEGRYAVSAFVIAVLFVFLFDLCLIIYKQNRMKRPVPIGITTVDIPMEQPGHQTPAWSEPKMPFKEAVIRTFMFVFVLLVGASVSLTIILLMALK